MCSERSKESVCNYVVTESGVVVWKTPEAHPLLKHTDTCHPDFLRKAEELFSKGKAKGLPRICSQNSEDACTWYYFSPLTCGVWMKDPDTHTSASWGIRWSNTLSRN